MKPARATLLTTYIYTVSREPLVNVVRVISSTYTAIYYTMYMTVDCRIKYVIRVYVTTKQINTISRYSWTNARREPFHPLTDGSFQYFTMTDCELLGNRAKEST